MGRVIEVGQVYHYGDSLDDFFVKWVDETGAAISLSGYTATMRIKTAFGPSGTLVLELNSAGQGLTIDAPNGKVSFSASATKMKSGSLVQGTKYYYDLQVANVVETKTLIKGEFWVDPEATDV